jgi:hypothetical protein
LLDAKYSANLDYFLLNDKKRTGFFKSIVASASGSISISPSTGISFFGAGFLAATSGFLSELEGFDLLGSLSLVGSFVELDDLDGFLSGTLSLVS